MSVRLQETRLQCQGCSCAAKIEKSTQVYKLLCVEVVNLKFPLLYAFEHEKRAQVEQSGAGRVGTFSFFLIERETQVHTKPVLCGHSGLGFDFSAKWLERML
jgi:hypothetical protein